MVMTFISRETDVNCYFSINRPQVMISFSMSMASMSSSVSKPFQCSSYQLHVCITSGQPAILVVVCLLIQFSKCSWLLDSHVHLVVNPTQFQSKSPVSIGKFLHSRKCQSSTELLASFINVLCT